ncbi:hypothetical protein [Blastopirellula marina]|uniref:SLA1 homology domain-containing protein n=1 Tax=Blastopirellula marina TaxID=124 RepID=A0A2S8F6X1_9BACT|nr:hypothetical protein [Blastopirellula marina]PQO27902.1 hypothetical protein C5Y98_26620 [Blastopirellula marina]PTL41638.1 hypothetical protein C5Y97_26635 [Blastopirellula marina]
MNRFLILVTTFGLLAGCSQQPERPKPTPADQPQPTDQANQTGQAAGSENSIPPPANPPAAAPTAATPPEIATNVPAPLPSNLVAMDGLNTDDWIASTKPDPLVKVIPTTSRIAETKQGIRFSVLTGESLFRFRPVLRRHFVVRFTVTLDEVPQDSQKVTWAAGTCSASESQLEIVIPATANIADGKPHDFEFSFAPKNCSLKFDGHLCKTMANEPEDQPWPRQFYLFGRGAISFTVSNFQVFADPISFQPNIEPRAITSTPGIRPTIFQKRPPIDGETQVDVGGEIVRAVFAREGQLMILHNRGKQSLQILDVAQRKLQTEFPVTDEPLLLAAGRDHVVVYLTQQRKLITRSLDTFEIVGAKDIPENAKIEHLTMGAAADKLLTLRHDSKSDLTIEFLNPATLEPLDIEFVQAEKRPLELERVLRIRAGFRGQAYGIAREENSNRVNNRYSLQIFGNQAIVYDMFDTDRYGGKFNFGAAGLWPNTSAPSLEGNFQLDVERIAKNIFGSNAADCKVTLKAPGVKKPLATFTDLDVTEDSVYPVPAIWGDGDLLTTERIAFLESQNTIVTIPRTNRHVTFRDFDLAEHLNQQTETYCYVEHRPTLRAVRGTRFQAQIPLVTNGELTKKLYITGYQGEGVTIDNKTMTLTWDVPSEGFIGLVEVVIHADQSSGKSILSGTMGLEIVEPPAGATPAPSPMPQTNSLVGTPPASQPEANVMAAHPTEAKPATAQPKPPIEPPDENGFRTWTDVDGRTMSARLLKRVGDLIRVEQEDGRGFTIPLSRLSEADQQFVDQEIPK